MRVAETDRQITLPLFGVQFHPEAVLTQYGHELLENFCRLAEEGGVPA